MSEKYIEQRYAVYNRYNQSHVVFETTSLETAEKVAEILSKNFPDENKGNSFFILPSSFNSKSTEKLFEQQVVENYKNHGRVVIEDALRAENERLREALDMLITEVELAGDYGIDKEYIRDAQQALKEGKE